MAFDFACPDWAEKLARGETPIADLPLDMAKADRAVGIFNKLRLPDVIGQPELRSAAVAMVPITSSASYPVASRSGSPSAATRSRTIGTWERSSSGIDGRCALYAGNRSCR